MDVITGLPWSNGFDAIWVVVDRLTKMRHFVPYRTTTSAQDLADMFITDIFVSMAYLIISCLIEELSLRAISGNTCVPVFKYSLVCPPLFILRRMGKPNE